MVTVHGAEPPAVAAAYSGLWQRRHGDDDVDRGRGENRPGVRIVARASTTENDAGFSDDHEREYRRSAGALPRPIGERARQPEELEKILTKKSLPGEHAV